MQAPRPDSEPRLERSLSLTVFVAYGVGTMVGAGYYALLGEVAGKAGLWTPVAFLVAGLVAFVSSISFGALSARFPVSAGEARYVKEGFGRRWFGSVVGWLVIATGVVSAATLANAFARFLGDIVPVPREVSVVGLTIALGFVSAWGIKASAVVAITITVVELLGLVWVFVVTAEHLPEIGARASEALTLPGDEISFAVIGAAFLAFYAFVGFEDMVNLAEEVKEPRKNLPRGIMVAIVCTTLLYVLVATTSVLAVSPEELAAARTPLALLAGEPGGIAAYALIAVSLLTGINGALVQIVMASRIIYGLAKTGGAPQGLGLVDARRRTPVRATICITAVVLAVALSLDMVALAQITSAVILIVFTLVQLSLWRILGKESRDPRPPTGVPSPPRWLPALGATLCVALLLAQIMSLL